MNKELYRPITRVITALILIILIKFAADLTLKNTDFCLTTSNRYCSGCGSFLAQRKDSE